MAKRPSKPISSKPSVPRGAGAPAGPQEEPIGILTETPLPGSGDPGAEDGPPVAFAGGAVEETTDQPDQPDPSDPSSPAAEAEADTKTDLPAPRAAKVAPRATPGDAFEQNPLSAIRDAAPEGVARHGMDDGTRVREALRSVIEEGETLKEAAREWNVAPSTIAEWRARYQDLLAQDAEPQTPLMDIGHAVPEETSSYIPEAAREIFLENWERLVTETAAQPSDFIQSPRQIFLQTSPLTSWLFTEGRLDRGILSGAVSGLIGIAILTSFLMADRNPPMEVALPEPAPRDDLLIETAATAAQSFFKAANWEERLKFVRQPEAVRGMMETYYQNHPDGPIGDAALTLALPSGPMVNLNFEIPSLNRSHFLCVIQSKGRFLVDWESSSLYQEDWINRLRETRPTEPTRIAVTVRKSEDESYFNYDFRDASRWECYQLGYPGLNLNLFGYALKDSSDSISLDAMLGIIDQHAVVLEVRYPPGAQSGNQVEIVSVLRGEWVPVEP